MLKVTFTTKPQTFPAGTVGGSFQYSLSSLNGYSNTHVGDASGAEFPDATAPGDYTATVQLLAADGSPLGSPMMGTGSIPQSDGVSLDVPDVITVA